MDELEGDKINIKSIIVVVILTNDMNELEKRLIELFKNALTEQFANTQFVPFI